MTTDQRSQQYPDVAKNYCAGRPSGSLRLFHALPQLLGWQICQFWLHWQLGLHLNYLSINSIYATIAGRFYRKGIIITLTIHSISGFTCLYWAFMQLYAYSLRCCSNFQLVINFLIYLINHSFSFSSGYIKWVIFFFLIIHAKTIFRLFLYVMTQLLSQWNNSGTVLCWTRSLWENEWLLQVGCVRKSKSFIHI